MGLCIICARVENPPNCAGLEDPVHFGGSPSSRSPISRDGIIPDDLAHFDHNLHVTQGFAIFQRIALHHNEVSGEVRRNISDLVLPPSHSDCVSSANGTGSQRASQK